MCRVHCNSKLVVDEVVACVNEHQFCRTCITEWIVSDPEELRYPGLYMKTTQNFYVYWPDRWDISFRMSYVRDVVVPPVVAFSFISANECIRAT